MMINNLVYCVGVVTIISMLVKLVRFANIYFRTAEASKIVLDRYKRDSETWALITGASDGIGFGLAQELVERGFGVILLARNKEKMEKAKARLEREFLGAKVKLLVLNVMTGSTSDFEHAIDSIKDLNVTVLANNVGGYGPMEVHFRTLADFTLKEVDEFIDLNSRSMARITNLALPILQRNSPSLIVNITSTAMIGIPWLVMYSGTKGFTSSFSKALAREIKATNSRIDVICAVPGDVQSQSNKVSVGLAAPSSRTFAKMTLDRVAPARAWDVLELSPHPVQAIFSAMADAFPEPLVQMAVTNAMYKTAKRLNNIDLKRKTVQ